MGVKSNIAFIDLIGSTAAFEAIGNARVAEMVTQTTHWIGEICVSHGGWVVKIMGDGVLAAFPAGSGALNAVLEIQRSHEGRMADYPQSLRLPIRSGIATGDIEVVAEDCYGDAVNVASRLSDLCGANQILTDRGAVDFSNDIEGIRVCPLGPITLRGRIEPCFVFQVEWNNFLSGDVLTVQASIDSDLGFLDMGGGQVTLSYAGQTQAFKFMDMPIQIGRARSAIFAIDDPQVSRLHCRMDWRNGVFTLTDTSTYGTWVRFQGIGSDMVLRREECALHGSGEISLGAGFGSEKVPTVKFSVS
jgi:adenylate cyclase